MGKSLEELLASPHFQAGLEAGREAAQSSPPTDEMYRALARRLEQHTVTTAPERRAG